MVHSLGGLSVPLLVLRRSASAPSPTLPTDAPFAQHGHESNQGAKWRRRAVGGSNTRSPGRGYDQGLDLGEPLAKKGLRVIAMSRFGYRRTPLPVDGSAAAQADAHACLLEALGIERAAVIGASAGAPSAMQFALRYPERCCALILLVPAAYAPRPGGAAAVTPPMESLPTWARQVLELTLRSDFIFWAAQRISPASMIRTILGTPPDVVDHASDAEQARVATVLAH